jgi:ribonuclease BN (tRNA processing enzyme)
MGKQLRIQTATTYLLALICSVLASGSLAMCRAEGVDLQILGSGGPLGRGNRASSGYLLWIDGEARVMVDAGGGTFLRFHEAGATVETLDLLAISHLHPDHASEIPALYWVHGFTTPIAGPSGSEQLPSITEFMQRLFQSDDAAFRVLRALRDTEVIEIDASGESETVMLETDDYLRTL